MPPVHRLSVSGRIGPKRSSGVNSATIPAALRLAGASMIRKQYALSASLSFLLYLLPLAACAQQFSPLTGARLGNVHFETSCSRAAQSAFDRAVALPTRLSSAPLLSDSVQL